MNLKKIVIIIIIIKYMVIWFFGSMFLSDYIISSKFEECNINPITKMNHNPKFNKIKFSYKETLNNKTLRDFLK